jgi:hypothetical protein
MTPPPDRLNVFDLARREDLGVRRCDAVQFGYQILCVSSHIAGESTPANPTKPVSGVRCALVLVFPHRHRASIAESAMYPGLWCVDEFAAYWRSARIPNVRYSCLATQRHRGHAACMLASVDGF